MAKDMAIITVHGMGDTQEDYYEGLERKLRKAVGRETWDDRVQLEHVYYQDLLQGNQEEMWDAMDDEYDLRWDSLRKFMLYAFSDAVAIEHSLRKDQVLYKAVHQTIATAFDNAYVALGNEAKPVMLIAQSLGAQEVSNYIWDAMHNERLFEQPGDGDAAQRAFRRFGTCRYFVTTGCNIPLFKSGLNDPQNFERPNADFTWLNFFDRDDVLGYPLRTMAPSYEVDWLEDHEVSVGGFFTGWNPFSHIKYWTDKDVINPIAEKITAIL